MVGAGFATIAERWLDPTKSFVRHFHAARDSAAMEVWVFFAVVESEECLSFRIGVGTASFIWESRQLA